MTAQTTDPRIIDAGGWRTSAARRDAEVCTCAARLAMQHMAASSPVPQARPPAELARACLDCPNPAYPEGPQLWRGPLRKVLSATLLPEPVHIGCRQPAKREHLRRLTRDDQVDFHRPSARTVEQPGVASMQRPCARCQWPAAHCSRCHRPSAATHTPIAPLPHQCGRSLRAAAAPHCTAHAAGTDAAAYSRSQTSLCAHNRLTTADHAASRAARSPSSARRARAPPPPPLQGRCLRRHAQSLRQAW